MSNPLSTLIDSGKKVRMRPDKILAQIFLTGLSGTMEFSNGEVFRIIISQGKVFSEKSAEYLAETAENSVFSISSEIDSNITEKLKPVDIIEFIYEIILKLNRKKVISFFEPVILEHFSIKPEAGKLEFLQMELEPFRGKPVIEIFSNIRKSYAVIYFLLLTRFAGIVQSDENSRARIKEKFERSGLFKEESEEPIEVETEEEKLINYLNVLEKFKNVFHLFELSDNFTDEKELHKKYLKIAQKVHPDKLVEMNKDIKERADKFFRIVNDNYKILKDPEIRKDIAKLMRRYGNIKSFDEYMKVKAYDKALFKGKTLARIGAHKDAATIFDEIYKQTKQPNALEFKLLSKWQVAQKMTDEEKRIEYPKLREEFAYLKQLKDPTLDVLFIMVEMEDFLKNYSDAIKIINLILKIFPDNFRAKGLKKKILYYRNLEAKGKINK